MSHFTVLCVVPKSVEIQKQDANIHEGDDDWQNAYNNQYESEELYKMLAPYSEVDEDYMEESLYEIIKLSEFFTDFKYGNGKKAIKLLQEEVDNAKEFIEEVNKAIKDFDEEKAKEPFATQLEDLEKKKTRWVELLTYRRETTDTVSNLINTNQEMPVTQEFKEMIYEYFWSNDDNIRFENDYKNQKITVWEVGRYNPQAKWDWWVVGGRWRNMGDNGLFEDLSVFQETVTKPYWTELGFFKLMEIESLTKDQLEEMDEYQISEILKKPKQLVKKYSLKAKTKNGDKRPLAYFTPEELLQKVTRPKVGTYAYLFPEEGWIEKSEMGWFGISEMDTYSFEEQERIWAESQKEITDLMEKYKDTHVGIVVDCHI